MILKDAKATIYGGAGNSVGDGTEKGKGKRVQYQAKFQGGELWLKPTGCSETTWSHSELFPAEGRELQYLHLPPHRSWLRADSIPRYF